MRGIEEVRLTAGNLPVVIAACAPKGVTLAANRGGEGWLPIPAMFELCVCIEFIEDAGGLLWVCNIPST